MADEFNSDFQIRFAKKFSLLVENRLRAHADGLVDRLSEMAPSAAAPSGMTTDDT